LCHKLPLPGEHLHYYITCCLCTGTTYIIVSQAVFAWGTPILLHHKLPLHREHLHYCHKLPLPGEHRHYCVTSCLCIRTPILLHHKLPLHREHLHYCHKLPCLGNTDIIVSLAVFALEHLYYCITSYLCTENTYIIVTSCM
jgi:hypothetical protein